MESSEDAIISKTLEGRILTWNSGAERVYGYPAEEAIGRPMTLLLPADRAGEEAEILEKVARGERVEHFDTVRQTKQGAPIDVSLTISPIRDAQGRIIGASHIARDITSRKRLEEQLWHLASIVESSEDAIIGKTLDGTILTWNSGAQRVYGYQADEIVGQRMSMLLPPERINDEAEILERISRGERVEHFDTTRLTKSGALINVSLTISPIRDHHGRIIGASHVARDISERKGLEDQLGHLASIVESSEDAIIGKTLDGTIISWNAGAERVYGYSAAEAIGHQMTFLLPADRADEEATILAMIARGERVEHFDTVRRKKNGEPIDVSITISPIHDKSGRIKGASHVARDISARKRLDEHLRHTQKLESLGVLAGGVAHDFNNLLTGILGNASLALESLPLHDPIRDLLQDAVNASERASHLTRQLLAYAGKGRFLIEPINISSLVREISSLIQTSITKNVQLRLELRDDLPFVQGDSSQLQQLVMNLVINGAEAIGSDTGGAVLVTTGLQEVERAYLRSISREAAELEPGAYVTLEVRDTGCGMDEGTLSRIFDPFFTTKFTGRGLGLAAVQGIVRGHKGILKVDTRPGAGTTFTVLLPASSCTLAPERPAVPRLRAQDELILVIDDEEVVRRTAKSMLERYGYRVVLAENGKEGVELFQVLADKVSAVVLDMTMPVMNGEQAFTQLKAIQPQVKVILSSGYNELEATRRFSGKGIAGFLQKPYSTSTLIEKISAVRQER